MARLEKNSVSVESVLADLLALSLRERLEVIARAAEQTESELSGEPKQPTKPLYGLWKVVSISAEEIDEARREMWSNFPRDDI